MSSKAIHLFAKYLKRKSEKKQNYYFIDYYESNKRHEDMNGFWSQCFETLIKTIFN
jgi:hypothetical protein